MNDTYWLLLLNCFANMGNYDINTKILDDRKKHSIENILESILAELTKLNERLENGDKLSR